MTNWHSLVRNGIPLLGYDRSIGNHKGGGPALAVSFQHGLTGDESQIAECFPTDAGSTAVRRLTLHCRGHGGAGENVSAQGATDSLSIDTFARDVLAFLDQRGVDRFVAGGISMGAAISLRLAHLVPDRVQALILVRPAWAWQAAPPNMAPFIELARWLRQPDRVAAQQQFEATPLVAELRQTGPDNLKSILTLFDEPNRLATADLIEAIARDGPGLEWADLQKIRVPTLVIGNELDAVHPLALATELAAAIPRSTLRTITPKAIDKTAYLTELRQSLREFLASLAGA